MIAGLSAVVSHGFPSRLDTTAARFLDAENDVGRHHMNCMSVGARILPPSQACRLGASGVRPHVLLWGDSHAVVTATSLEQAANRHNAAFLFAASVDCPIGIGLTIEPRTGSFVSTPAYQYCGEYNRLMLQLAANNPDIKSVVLSSRWTNWRVGERGTPAEGAVDIRLKDDSGAAQSLADNKVIFARGFELLVQALVGLKKTVWIEGPLPEPSVRVPKGSLYRASWIGSIRALISRLRHLQRDTSSFSDCSKQSGKNIQCGSFGQIRFLCGETSCPVAENGMPLFLDDNHLSVYGARKTSPLYDVIFSGL